MGNNRTEQGKGRRGDERLAYKLTLTAVGDDLGGDIGIGNILNELPTPRKNDGKVQAGKKPKRSFVLPSSQGAGMDTSVGGKRNWPLGKKAGFLLVNRE